MSQENPGRTRPPGWEPALIFQTDFRPRDKPEGQAHRIPLKKRDTLCRACSRFEQGVFARVGGVWGMGPKRKIWPKAIPGPWRAHPVLRGEVTGLGFEPEIDDLGGPFQPRAGRPPDHPSSPYCWRGIPLDLNVRRDALGFHGRGLPWTNPNCVSFGVTDVPITIAVDISTKWMNQN